MSDWTVDTLKAHYDEILAERMRGHRAQQTEQRASTDRALAANAEAIRIAQEATERRFASVNEFRQTLADQNQTFTTRVESEAQHQRLTERLDQLTTAVAALIPRTEVDAAVSRNTERLQEITDRINRAEGHGTGIAAGWGYLVVGVGMIATIITVYLSLRRG